VLGFLSIHGTLPRQGNELLEALSWTPTEPMTPWFGPAAELTLPFRSNVSAIRSKAATLQRACESEKVQVAGIWACVVLPGEFNRLVGHTKNKSLVLFQKCGRLLQQISDCDTSGPTYVLVDRHGGRISYRKLLGDVFPDFSCKVVREEQEASVYRFAGGDHPLSVGFKKDGDCLALPVALASIIAKYVRELFMQVFNSYWQERVNDLAPTAGYGTDGRRFFREIQKAAKQEGADTRRIVRER
jgi:ribonuclease HII